MISADYPGSPQSAPRARLEPTGGRHVMRRLTMLALAAIGLAACGGTPTTTTNTPFKAAWIYVGAASDAGWTKAHDDGRLYVQQQLGSKVQTTFKENVPEGPQASHPGATVRVIWTSTWFDPAKEKKAAESLIQLGVDVLGQGQDSPATGDA